MARRVLRREAVVLTAAVALTIVGAVGYYLSRATTLTIVVAPKGGTETALIGAFAERLAARRKDIRLKIRLDARKAPDAEALRAMTREIDDLAAGIARFALNRPVEERTIGAASIAIDAARSSVRAGMEAVTPRSAGAAER